MFLKFFFTLSILFIGSISSDIDEAVVETVDIQEDNEIPNTLKSETRNGKLLFSYPPSPIVDMVMQSQSAHYATKNGDFFEFLRDSYPLPDGKYDHSLYLLHNLNKLFAISEWLKVSIPIKSKKWRYLF